MSSTPVPSPDRSTPEIGERDGILFPGQSRRSLLKLAGGALVAPTVLAAAAACDPKSPKAATPSGTAPPTPASAPRLDQAARTTGLWSDAAVADPAGLLPMVLGSVENARLTANPLTFRCRLQAGVTYRVRALVESGAGTADKAALIAFAGATGGTGLSSSQALGRHLRLRTGPGLHQTDHLITVANEVTQYGLRTVADSGDIVLRTLSIEQADEAGGPVDFFFSFDTEAALNRATANHIDTLIWGKVNGGQYGIPRLCDVLEQHHIKGNFMIDFGSCTRDGERPLRAIVDYVAGRGHDLHVHLHTDDLPQRWGLHGGNLFRMEKTTYEMNRRLLDFATRTYQQVVGRDPRVFRSGAYMFNPSLVHAAKSLGYTALTNVHEDAVGDPAIAGDPTTAREPFVWENGILEIPVDSSSQEASPFPNFVARYNEMIRRKRHERTFNIVMHSWSMLRLNDKKIFEGYAPEYEDHFHQMCEYANQHGTPRTYSSFLELQRPARPVTLLSFVKPAVAPAARVQADKANAPLAKCLVCDMTVAVGAAPSGVCPSCGSQAEHRHLKSVINRFGDALAGRHVLAYEADRLRILGLLETAAETHSYDPAKKTPGINAGSVDCFVAIGLVKDTATGTNVTAEAMRTLAKGGVFLSTADYVEDGAAADVKGMRLQEYLNILSSGFQVSSVPGFDPVTATASRIFLAVRKE